MSSPVARPCAADVVIVNGVALVMPMIDWCGHSLPTPSWSTQTRSTRETCTLPSLSAAPTAIRARMSYQAALESGRSAEELDGAPEAAHEVAELWDFVDRFLFGRASLEAALA